LGYQAARTIWQQCKCLTGLIRVLHQGRWSVQVWFFLLSWTRPHNFHWCSRSRSYTKRLRNTGNRFNLSFCCRDAKHRTKQKLKHCRKQCFEIRSRVGSAFGWPFDPGQEGLKDVPVL
jgi:hypothetical protein